jgi:hypothetical protein
MFGGKKKKLDRLREAMSSAQAARTGDDQIARKAAVAELRSAWADSPDSELDGPARKLLEELRGEVTSGDVEVDVELPPCGACGGIELFRSRFPAHFDQIYIGNAGVHLEFDLLICRACGDTRLLADPAKVASAFTALDMPGFRRIVVKRAPQGPFR